VGKVSTQTVGVGLVESPVIVRWPQAWDTTAAQCHTAKLGGIGFVERRVSLGVAKES
jgi:hypothetical protein